jgi:capsular polysaccharide biosynthesis protein
VLAKNIGRQSLKEENYYDDEIDLREIILTLIKGWKVILLTTVLAGAAAFGYSKMQAPIYEASTTLTIDQAALTIDQAALLTINPDNLLVGDEAKEIVADILDTPAATLPTPVITNNKTLFTITIQSANAEEASRIANAWADGGLQIIDLQLEEMSINLDLSIADMEAADSDLVSYLRQQELSQWTWAELAALTGVSDSTSIIILTNIEERPNISDKERLEIAHLMFARVAAEKRHEITLEKATLASYAAEKYPPLVLNYAPVPEKPVSPKTLVNTALGLVVGVVLGVFWIFTANWWQNTNSEKKKTV